MKNEWKEFLSFYRKEDESVEKRLQEGLDLCEARTQGVIDLREGDLKAISKLEQEIEGLKQVVAEVESGVAQVLEENTSVISNLVQERSDLQGRMDEVEEILYNGKTRVRVAEKGVSLLLTNKVVGATLCSVLRCLTIRKSHVKNNKYLNKI